MKQVEGESITPEAYCQGIIAAMKKDPGNHQAWEQAVAAVNHPHVAWRPGGVDLAARTLCEVREIHFDACTDLHPRT